MYKVEFMEAYGQGAMGGNYWTYQATVMVKGSVKRAIAHARKRAYESNPDQEGLNWVPILDVLKVWKDNQLIINNPGY